MSDNDDRIERTPEDHARFAADMKRIEARRVEGHLDTCNIHRLGRLGLPMRCTCGMASLGKMFRF